MEQEPLKLFLDRSLISPRMSYIPLLYPYLGVIRRERAPYETHTYEAYGFDPKYFVLVDAVADADYIVVPHNYRRIMTREPELFPRFEQLARESGKPLLLDDSGDTPMPHDPANSVVTRFGTYRFLQEKSTVITPLPAEDLLETYREGKFTPRQKRDAPTVGFVGWTRISPLRRVKTYIKECVPRLRALFDVRYRTLTKGVLWRASALKALARTSGVELQALQRASFGGRTDTAEDAARWRKEFVDNLEQCDYALCIKGDDNVSYRFYEALSMGRIPLFVDTECVLPLEDDVEYRSFCVFIDWRDAGRIGEKLREFHARVSPEEFEAMQRRAREAYEHYLRLDACSPHLARLLKEMAAVR